MDDKASVQLNRLTRENQRLHRAVDELSILNEIATAISSTLSLNEIIRLVVQKCVKHLNVEQAAVMILDQQAGDKPFQTMVRQADTTSEILPYRLDTQLTGWMLKNRQPLVINDLHNDERFANVVTDDVSIRSMLSVPLLSKGEMIGIITVFNKKDGDFTADAQRLLTIIATQSTQVIENARLLVEEQALLRVQEEMRMAKDIQMNLLPQNSPQIAGYDIAGLSIPAKAVGGDYFDFIEMNAHHLAFCLGDGTGKGLPAAMLMANTQATIRGQSLLLKSPKDCIHNANQLMYYSTGLGKFVTLFYGILDTEKHQLVYCNAGHDTPMLVHQDQTISRLDVGGVVLGFVPQFDYAEEAISLQPGDTLVIYSDGVTEAMNAKEEEFGETRLQELILSHRQLTAQELIDEIVTAVRKHADGTPQSDDITLLVVKR